MFDSDSTAPPHLRHCSRLLQPPAIGIVWCSCLPSVRNPFPGEDEGLRLSVSDLQLRASVSLLSTLTQGSSNCLPVRLRGLFSGSELCKKAMMGTQCLTSIRCCM
eukprot:3305127-Rhodomonas_salina.3